MDGRNRKARILCHISISSCRYHERPGMDLEIFSHFMIMQQLRLLRFYPLKKALKWPSLYHRGTLLGNE